MREARQTLGLTHAELAKAAGVSTTTISRHENGASSMNPAPLRKIAKKLKVPAEEIGQVLSPSYIERFVRMELLLTAVARHVLPAGDLAALEEEASASLHWLREIRGDSEPHEGTG